MRIADPLHFFGEIVAEDEIHNLTYVEKLNAIYFNYEKNEFILLSDNHTMYSSDEEPFKFRREEDFNKLYNYFLDMYRRRRSSSPEPGHDTPPPLDISRDREITYNIFDGIEAGIELQNIPKFLHICRNVISYEYLKMLRTEAADLNNGVSVVMQYANGDEVGCAILRPLESNRKLIYVDLFCTSSGTRGLGEKLLAFIKNNICKSCKIRLNAVQSAVGFYKKMGFRKVEEDNPFDDTYFLEHNLEGGRKKRRI